MTFIITEKNSIFFPYKQHAWKVYSYKNAPQIKKYLTKSFQYVETMLLLYSKVFMVRFELFPSQFNKNNKCVKGYLDQLTKTLSEKYQCQCGYICAREQDISDKEHYHVAMFLSGHKIQYSNSLFDFINAKWKCQTGGCTSWSKNCYYMLQRGRKSSLEAAIYRLSYLTKANTKQRNPKGVSSVIFGKLHIPKEIASGDNDILLVDARFNIPLSRIRVTPLLYAGTSTSKNTILKVPTSLLITTRFSSEHTTNINAKIRQNRPAYRYKDWMT